MNECSPSLHLSGGPAHHFKVTFATEVLAVGVMFYSDDHFLGPNGTVATYRPGHDTFETAPRTCRFDSLREARVIGRYCATHLSLLAPAASNWRNGRAVAALHVQERPLARTWLTLGRLLCVMGYVGPPPRITTGFQFGRLPRWADHSRPHENAQ